MGLLLDEILSDKCEKCGVNIKAGSGSEQKKWCHDCIALYRRMQNLSPGKVAKRFVELVGEKFIDADIKNLDENHRDKLVNASGDVYLWGSVGTGKTYAMAAMVKKLLCEGFECECINFDIFCCKVRSTMNKGSKQSEQQLIDKMVDVNKLFIDDMGLRSKQETDFAYVTFYAILNSRQNRLRPTYISTNKSLQQLSEGFDARILSRLDDKSVTVIEMSGKDRRKS